MPITEQVMPFYIKDPPGMNTKAEELELNGKWAKLAQNCRFEDEPGAVTKRPPLAYYNSSPVSGTGGILGLYRYYGTTNIKTIMAMDDKIYVGDDTSGTFTQIRDLTTSGYRTSFVTYQDLVIGCNGQEYPWVYDGSSDNLTWELGSCKAKLTSGGTNLDSGATYSYRVTMDNDAYVCGTTSNVVTTDGSNRKVTLSYIPLGPTGTANRKVYRTEGGGSTYKLLTTIADNTTTTYVDDIADASLGAAYPTLTDEMVKGDILLIHRERLFISGDPVNTNTIYYSNVYLPHYIQSVSEEDYMLISPEDGDEIMGLAIQLGTLVCIKKNTIRKLYVAAATSGADPATWYAEDPIAFTGSPCKWSIIQTSYGIVFLGWNHWYLFDGARLSVIIDEFDTKDILPAQYSNVVCYFLHDILYAAYADTTIAPLTNNRVMVYNFRRNRFSIDTISASAFTAHIGDDESGELYIGSSSEGTVWKAEESDLIYRLASKTDCNAGTKSNAFVGGTESQPFIEIGSDTAPQAIPNDVVIFWDDPTTNPGVGWTDITSEVEGKYIYFSSTYGTNGGGTGHTHTVSGTTSSTSGTETPTGNNFDDSCQRNQDHSHSISVASSNGQTTFGPRHVILRLFKKNSSTTEYEFPVGAIVMYDQSDTPDGFVPNTSSIGYYIKGGAAANYFIGVESSHYHTMSGSTDGWSGNHKNCYNGGNCPKGSHSHSLSGTLGTSDNSTWELDYVSFRFIKKAGDQGTWDGVAKYVYCLFASSGAASNGWTKIATYDSRFLKIGSAAPDTGAAANYSHTHGGFSGATGAASGSTAGGNGDEVGMNVSHTHSYSTLTVASGSLTNPPYRTFCLIRKILGQMATYNSAISVSETNGIWTSPPLELLVESFGAVSFNVSIETGDSFTWFIRTGSTQSSVQDATAIGTVDHTTNKFTQAGHGLSNGDRIVINGSVIPTGLTNTRMYYVVGVSGNDFQVSLTSGGSAVDFSTNGTSVTFKKWSNPVTVSGTQIAATANNWVQYCCVFTAVDTTISNPRVYLSSNYVVKIVYAKLGATAEAAVEFKYQLGKINMNEPFMDKVFRKVGTNHSGTEGSMIVLWETENSSNSFTVDLSIYSARWDSYFQDTAMGREIDLTVYKNDLYDLTLKEIQGFFNPQPVIL